MHSAIATAYTTAVHAATNSTIMACSSLPASKRTSHSLWSPIAKPIADVLAGFYAVVPNVGVAIILLALVWMIIIAPLTLKSTRSMLAMQKLQPQLNKLKQKHANDRQAFAEAQMELFREEGVSPFGSCLPMLLPLPIFFALFEVIDHLSHKVTIANGVKCPVPEYLSPHTQLYRSIVGAHGHINAFGVDLAKSALSSHSSLAAAIPYFVILLIMIGTQYLQTAQMMSRNPAAADNPQAKMMKFVPLIFGVFCIRFPAGVVLYYAVSNLCRIGQQSAMYRFDPKVKALVNKDISEVEAITKDIDEGKRKVSQDPAGKSSQPSKGVFRRMLDEAADQQAQARKAKQQQGSGTSKNGKPAAKSGSASKPTTQKRQQSSGQQQKARTSGKPTGSGSKPPRSGGKPPASSSKPPNNTNRAQGRTGAARSTKRKGR